MEKMLQYVLEISRRMAETRQLDPLLDYAMQEALQLIGAERGYLVLLHDDDTLEFRVKRDAQGNELAGGEGQISKSILWDAINNNRPVLLADALEDGVFGAFESVMGLKLRSVMVVPLNARGQTIGAIFVENNSEDGAFTEGDLLPLTLFANQAGTAIENAMLNEGLEARVQARTVELETALQQLEHSWLEAVENNRLRTGLLANVVHDIRSPLSLVLNVLVMLRDELFGAITEEQRTWVVQALASVDHIVKLTNDIFDLTKLEVGQLSLTPEPTDLHQFLQGVHQVGEGFPWPEAVAYRLDLPPTLPVLEIDPTRIRQVILNLLSNALKFTREGSITLYARVEDGAVLIGVADSGGGIPADQLDTVFERFRQVDEDAARRRQGTGLGLAICRELVEMHGGRIWVESEPGQGADFRFTLPLQGVL